MILSICKRDLLTATRSDPISGLEIIRRRCPMIMGARAREAALVNLAVSMKAGFALLDTRGRDPFRK